MSDKMVECCECGVTTACEGTVAYTGRCEVCDVFPIKVWKGLRDARDKLRKLKLLIAENASYLPKEVIMRVASEFYVFEAWRPRKETTEIEQFSLDPAIELLNALSQKEGVTDV